MPRTFSIAPIERGASLRVLTPMSCSSPRTIGDTSPTTWEVTSCTPSFEVGGSPGRRGHNRWMPTRKQRRRRAKEHRHEYVWEDGEGNVLESNELSTTKSESR